MQPVIQSAFFPGAWLRHSKQPLAGRCTVATGTIINNVGKPSAAGNTGLQLLHNLLDLFGFFLHSTFTIQKVLRFYSRLS